MDLKEILHGSGCLKAMVGDGDGEKNGEKEILLDLCFGLINWMVKERCT